MPTLEQLYNELDLNVKKSEMEKTASVQAGSKLEDIWNQTMRYESNAVSETHTMEDNMNVFQKMAMNKQAAAEEKALDTMCIGAAFDHLSGNMNKSASMQKVALEKRAAGQNLILQHCAQFGFNPEYCINKEASDFQIDSEIEKLHKRAQYVAQLVMAGFNKAAADAADTSPTAATMGSGVPTVMPNDTYPKKNPETFAQPSGPVGPGVSTTVDGLVAKAKNASNYGAQGQINHSFLSSSSQMA
jgi:hypothetical protein